MLDADRDEVIKLIDEEAERILFGKWADSYNIDKLAWLSAGITSSNYVMENMRRACRYESSSAILSDCLNRVTLDGLILEFGVYSGETIKRIALQNPDKHVFGFDSFQGLPEPWREGFEQGQFAMPTIPAVPTNVELIVGWFNETLPRFALENRVKKVAFLHVDCDLYSSTVTVLSELRSMIVPGTIILFDEFLNYPGWQHHEARAFEEFCKAYEIRYEFIGFVPHHQQVAVRIIGH